MGKANPSVNKVVMYLRQLVAGTDAVKKSEFFRRYLEVMSKFWRYSYHNQLLILCQMPQATRIAGFLKWQELGRWVKKGSKAIRILVPRIRKIAEINPENGELIGTVPIGSDLGKHSCLPYEYISDQNAYSQLRA